MGNLNPVAAAAAVIVVVVAVVVVEVIGLGFVRDLHAGLGFNP